MKVEPVYLLAPEPDRRVHLSRRTFVALSIGAISSGIALGYGMRAWTETSSPTQDDHDTERSQSPATDSRLEWARRLAADSDSALAASAIGFLVVANAHPLDRELQVGAQRLAALTISGELDAHRAIVAKSLLVLHDRIATMGNTLFEADVVRQLRQAAR